MSLLIGILLISMSIFTNPASDIDCSREEFVGTWKGKVEYNGDELAQGPYEISLHEDGKSLRLKDESGTEYTLEVDGCDAVNTVKEEGMKMKTTYTLSEGALKMLSLVEFPDGDGNMQKVEMKGSMSKVE